MQSDAVLWSYPHYPSMQSVSAIWADCPRLTHQPHTLSMTKSHPMGGRGEKPRLETHPTLTVHLQYDLHAPTWRQYTRCSEKCFIINVVLLKKCESIHMLMNYTVCGHSMGDTQYLLVYSHKIPVGCKTWTGIWSGIMTCMCSHSQSHSSLIREIADPTLCMCSVIKRFWMQRMAK